MSELFSVVIPLFNKAHTIVDTLDSVLSQKFQGFEVVVVDDGSTDGGPAKVERRFRDHRIRLIRQEHQGDGGARNRGVAAAGGELIAILDADDLWLPGYLTEICEAAREFPGAGMFCCGGVTLYRDGSGYIRQSRSYQRTQTVEFFVDPYFFGNASSTVFRRDLFAMAGGFPVGMQHYGEAVFFFKLALNTTVVFCPELLTVYNRDIEGQVTADARANVAGIVDSVNQIYWYWNSLGVHQRNPKCLSAILRSVREGLRYSMVRNDHSLLRYFLDNVDPGILSRIHPVERLCYRRPDPTVGRALNKLSGIDRRIRRRPSPRFHDDIPGLLLSSAGYSPPARVRFTESVDVRRTTLDGVAGIDD